MAPPLEIVIRQGDSQPTIDVQFTGVDGVTGQDCTLASALTFTMTSRTTGVKKINAAPAEWLDKQTGKARYQLTDSDRDTADWYTAYFRATFPANETISFPDSPLFPMYITVYPD